MPRPKSDVFEHFTIVNEGDKQISICKYCSQKFTKNATKQRAHLEKCMKYPKRSRSVSPGPSTSSATESHVPSASSTTSAHSGTSQPSSGTHSVRKFFDIMDAKSQERADENLARAIYATGSPLSLTSNIYWQRFLKDLRPSYIPPSRHMLSTPLLQGEYDRVHEKVMNLIQTSDCVTLVSDGWSNIRGEGIINFIACTPQPVFFKSIDTKDNRHTGAYIADQLKAVIEEIGPNKVYATVTDNAANMKSAWTEIEEAYSHITPIGCSAHGLNLLLGDIMSTQTMQAIHSKAKTIVKFFRNKQVVSATFAEKQKQKGKPTSLKLPVVTRWGSTVIMFQSLQEGKESLQEVAIMDSLDIEGEIRKNILDNDIFWARITACLALLEPITSAIAQVESDSARLSDVYRLFNEIKQKINEALPTSPLQQQEEKKVREYIEKRRKFCVKPIHEAAYMLDPQFQNRNLQDDDQTEVIALGEEEIGRCFTEISKLAEHLHLDQGKVLASLAKFRAKDGLWKGEGVWASAKHVSPSTWWKGLCGTEAVSPIATILLQIPPSSASSERNWSLFGNIHTKTRNRLTNDRIQKLVSVRANLELLEASSDNTSLLEESHISEAYDTDDEDETSDMD
jgi:hypothetical protein